MVEIGIKGKQEGQETIGTHERFVIDEKKFAQKMETKKQ